MKRISPARPLAGGLLSTLALVLLSAAGLGLNAPPARATLTPARTWKEIQAPALTWKKPAPEVVKLKNGATLYLMEDHRLPLVNFYGLVRTGSIYDPEGKNGTAALTGTMLRTGGTLKHTWAQVDDLVDQLGMGISTGIGSESANASFNVLSENLAPALNLLFEMLREPAFDPDKLALAKEKQKEGIRRQNDNPVQIAIREFRTMLWGADNPRGFNPTFKTVDAITRADLVAFHDKYYVPGNMILGVSGDFNRKTIVALVEKAMGAWPNKTVSWPKVPDAVLTREHALYLADKESATQSTILIGRLSAKEGDPDQAALEVMDNILGSGGFTSRITQSVRNDRGLAYAAGSGLNIGRMAPGTQLIYAISKGESTHEALDVMMKEVERIRQEPVTAEELQRSRSALVNSAVFDYDSPEKVLSNSLDLGYYGLPQDLPERRLQQLGKVSADDVKRVAGLYLDPKTLQVMVAGSAKKFDKPLDDFGPVKNIQLKDPTLP